MQWIVNELSIDGNFRSVDEFLEELMQLLHLRKTNTVINDGLLCSRQIGDQPVVADISFRTAVMRYASRDTKSLILSWINKKGPYWDDDRAPNEDDYFEHSGIDVTDLGLGECSRRVLLNKDNAAVSLLSPNSSFNCDALEIVQGLPQEPLALIQVSNISDTISLQECAERARERPKNWATAIEYLRERFDCLAISSEVQEILQPHPFSSYVVERLEELLGVLHHLMESRDEQGRYTDETKEIIAKHFSGEKAWFTDESDSNKQKFEDQLTFKDPLDPDKTIFCPFHGKIKTPQFRIHFLFPEAEDKLLRVAYIGPKITKG